MSVPSGALVSGPVAAPNQLIPSRREIHDLIQDERQFSLYILALKSMMKDPFDNDYSFVSIAGIHGAPPVPWGNSGGLTPAPGTKFTGYCTHSSVLFPTWHRPYVAVFEQSLVSHAVSIVQKPEYKNASDHSEWETAAVTLRSPYWDWARKPTPANDLVPQHLLDKKIWITTPAGREEVENPLHSYSFQIPGDTFPDGFKEWKKTLRHPKSSSVDAESDMEKFKKRINDENPQIRARAFYSLTRLNTWEYFSNNRADHPSGLANSLESVHDTMHVSIGGVNPRGHMSSVPVAAFDAAFWLHHTNIDRYLALWQAINPDVWVTPGKQPSGTWTMGADAEVNKDSDLTPFWKSQGVYWTSEDVRHSTALQYTYPELADLVDKDKTYISREVLRRVKELYGSTPAPRWHQTNLAAPASRHEWNLHIKFKKFELGNSFHVAVHLGETYVGSVTAFVNDSVEHCANCRENLETEVEGFIHLTEVLEEKYADLPALDLDHVKPILERDLSLRVEASETYNTPREVNEHLPSLKVAVYSQTIGLPRNTPGGGHPWGSIPTGVDYYPDILEGKPGYTPGENW